MSFVLLKLAHSQPYRCSSEGNGNEVGESEFPLAVEEQ